MNDVLAGLEEKVQSAAQELRRLRQENQELRAELERLEKVEVAQPDPSAAAWQAERADVQRRVERLVGHLEDLLGEAS